MLGWMRTKLINIFSLLLKIFEFKSAWVAVIPLRALEDGLWYEWRCSCSTWCDRKFQTVSAIPYLLAHDFYHKTTETLEILFCGYSRYFLIKSMAGDCVVSHEATVLLSLMSRSIFGNFNLNPPRWGENGDKHLGAFRLISRNWRSSAA